MEKIGDSASHLSFPANRAPAAAASFSSLWGLLSVYVEGDEGWWPWVCLLSCGRWATGQPVSDLDGQQVVLGDCP